MKKRVLVTTALVETIKFNEPLLLLGDWCKTFDKRDLWHSKDFKVAKYIWDDRNKLFEDYNYSLDLFEKVLHDLHIKLNKINSVNYNSKFWRILIGPWLLIFIQIVLERWRQIKYVEKNYNINYTYISKNFDETLIPGDISSFPNHFESDFWNFNVYSFIIKNYSTINYKEINVVNNIKIKESKSYFLRNIIFRFLISPLTIFFKNYIIGFPLSKFQRLFFTFFGYFSLFFPKKNIIKSNINYDLRNKIQVNLIKDQSDPFLKCLYELIFSYIPTGYVEDFNQFKKNTSEYPYKVNKILTQDYYYDDFMKYWLACLSNNKTKIISSQHGGSYGISKFFCNEYHELGFSDFFLSWGWSNKKNNNKIIPFGFFQVTPFENINHRKAKKDKCLIVLGSISRYSYKLACEPVSKQFSNYINDQLLFISSISEKIRKSLIVRLAPNDYGWNIKSRLKDLDPSLRFNNANDSFMTNLKESKIIICTYNSTTFLEAFKNNIPTIIFWDLKYYELRDDVFENFSCLKKVGIFHTDPKSAAFFLIENWDNIDNWWYSESTQKVVNNFSNNFSKTIINKNFSLKNLLNNL